MDFWYIQGTFSIINGTMCIVNYLGKDKMIKTAPDMRD